MYIKQKKKKKMSLKERRALMGWVFVSPFVLGFLLLFMWIFIDSLKFSFMRVDVQPKGGFILHYVKMGNYIKMLRVDPSFNQNLVNAVRNMLINIPIIIMFSLFIATLLNKKMKGRTAFRAIFFLPVIMATGIIQKADMTNSVMNAYQGIDVGKVMDTAASVGGSFSAADLKHYLQQVFSFSPTLTSITVGAAENIYWVVNNSGVQILIFLAGLQGIAPALYEAAQIEGCSAWESFWKITFPMISPLILTNVVYSLVDSFTGADNSIMSQITGSVRMGDYGEASAMAWLYFAVISVLLLVIGLLVSRTVFYQNKE